MAAFYSATVFDFLAADPQAIAAHLASEQIRHFRISEPVAMTAWERTIAVLRTTLGNLPLTQGWRLLLEYPLLRLGRRIDAVLVAPQLVLVLEFKVNATSFAAADLRQVEDYALDLQDFHAASRSIPIIPILVATDADARDTIMPLPIGGVASPLGASAASLASLIDGLARLFPQLPVPIAPSAWEYAPYRPVPGILEAARMLYAGHGVAEITAARAGTDELAGTTGAILSAVEIASAERLYLVVFVTGVPGAGKTLVGLNVVFGAGRETGAAYLTGNPTLVHVLREALARDAAAGRGGALRAARQQVEGRIQALPKFRDHYVSQATEAPAEHVVVIDEAQRCWSREHAMRKTRDRRWPLTDSEPACLLDIMARHTDWAILVCLVGSGQEIHTGEGGLAEWGQALGARPRWQVQAAPAALEASDPRQRVPRLAGLTMTPALNLAVPTRAIRNAAGPAWVDAVLANELSAAREIAEREGGVPFLLTRDLARMQQALRDLCRGDRRAGLLTSSGARRLRAEGLGAELPHMDAKAVTQWFLDRWPDVRASDALELPATEFCCQGLELDYVGVCWGGDLIRYRGSWQVRRFVGTQWTTPRDAETIADRINTYRVLLTRARYETIIWVPKGDAADKTRPPGIYDAVFSFFLDCGASPLEDARREKVVPAFVDE